MTLAADHHAPRRWYSRWFTGWRGMVLSAVVAVPITNAVTWAWSRGPTVLIAIVCGETRVATEGQPPITSTRPDATGVLPKARADETH